MTDFNESDDIIEFLLLEAKDGKLDVNITFRFDSELILIINLLHLPDSR